MAEHLRALLMILVFASVIFALARAPLTAQACVPSDYKRRCTLWIVMTLVAFLSHSFWLFIAIAGLVLVMGLKSEPNRFALYFGLMLALPPISASLPGLGLFNELFAINFQRLLALCVLLPAFVALCGSRSVEPHGRLWCDKLLLAYLGLEVVLTLPHRTVTSVLRDSVFYAFTDVWLPYYVASRAVRSLAVFRDTIAVFVVSTMVLSVILAFEFARMRLLYSALAPAMGVFDYGWSTYLGRAEGMRAQGSIGHPLAAGYTCAVALGLYLYLRTRVPSGWKRHLGALVLVGGLVGALSRAPWVGAAMMLVLFVLLGPAPGRGLAQICGAVLALVPLLIVTPQGRKVIDLLPWIGTVEAHNVEGRERLGQVAFKVFLETPFFGRYDVLSHPEMEALRGGHGIIDLVNTYAVVALRGGGVSLALFVGFFVVAMVGLFKGMRRIPDHADEQRVLGRALLVTLIGVLFMIGTMSPTLNVPTVYWCLGGLAVGYAQMSAWRIADTPRAATMTGTLRRHVPRGGATRMSRAGATARREV